MWELSTITWSSIPPNGYTAGYLEMQKPPKRDTVIDLAGLSALCGFNKVADFQEAHRQWVAEALARKAAGRDERWSEAISVGSLAFVDKVKVEPGIRAMHREVTEAGGTHALRETRAGYASDFSTESDALRLENTILWEKILQDTEI